MYFFKFYINVCLPQSIFFFIPLKITFKLDYFRALKCWKQLCEMLESQWKVSLKRLYKPWNELCNTLDYCYHNTIVTASGSLAYVSPVYNREFCAEFECFSVNLAATLLLCSEFKRFSLDLAALLHLCSNNNVTN